MQYIKACCVGSLVQENQFAARCKYRRALLFKGEVNFLRTKVLDARFSFIENYFHCLT